MILAIDIEAFTEMEDYTAEVEALAEWVCSARPLPGFNKVYAPGEIEEETRQRRHEEGFDLPQAIIDSMAEVADALGVGMVGL